MTESRFILRESGVNATAGHGIYDIDTPLEHMTLALTSVGDLYRYGREEFGRCTGKVYVDGPGGPVHVGYVFQQRRKYEDSSETYLHETWLSLAREIPRRVEHVPLSELEA